MLPTESSVKVPAVIRPCLVPSMVMYAGVGMVLSLTVDGSGSALREPERSNSCATPGDFHTKQGLAIFSGAGAAQVRRNRELVNGAVCNFLRSAGRIWRRRILIRRHRGQAALSTGLSTAAGQQAAQRKTWSRKRKHPATTGPAGCFSEDTDAYLRVRIHSASWVASSSVTAFGGMGIGPHTPLEPFLM